jgi:uncharacterized protein (DUF302 family)
MGLPDACVDAALTPKKEIFMSYTLNRVIKNVDFDKVDERTRKALADGGFGILTEIDVKATMKKKLNKDMFAYRILGACNPTMAWEAIGLEPRVGAMLPCNVILRETPEGVEVSAVDPVSSMTAIDNEQLKRVAGEVRDLLSGVIKAI